MTWRGAGETRLSRGDLGDADTELLNRVSTLHRRGEARRGDRGATRRAGMEAALVLLAAAAAGAAACMEAALMRVSSRAMKLPHTPQQHALNTPLLRPQRLKHGASFAICLFSSSFA